MKCIKISATKFGTIGNTGMVVRRVNDDKAFLLCMIEKTWEYATRKMWKSHGRKWGIGLKGTDHVPTRKAPL